MKKTVQTLIFDKRMYTRQKALNWAKKNGFKHYTSRETKTTIRLRQMPPEKVKKVLGQFSISPYIKALYVIQK